MNYETFSKRVVQNLYNHMTSRGWKPYKLSLDTGINAQTIRNWFNEGAIPTLKNLFEACVQFGIPVAALINDGEQVHLPPDLKEFFDCMIVLTPTERAAVLAHAKSYTENRN